MDIAEWLEAVKSKPYHSDTQMPSNPFGFVVGWKSGRGYVMGPYKDEEEANTHTMEFDPDKFVVIWSRYSQQNKVTQGVKHTRFDTGEGLVSATERMKHKVEP